MTEIYKKRSSQIQTTNHIKSNVYKCPDPDQFQTGSVSIIKSNKSIEKQKRLEAKEARNKVKLGRAIQKLIKAGLPVNAENIKKQFKIAKELRAKNHKEQELRNMQRRKKERKEQVLLNCIDKSLIKIDKPKKNKHKLGFKVNSKKIKLYKTIAKRRKVTTECLTKINKDESLARLDLIESLKQKKELMAKVDSLSVAMPDSPIRFGEYPLYLKHFPLAPRYKQPTDMDSVSFIYVLIDPNDNTVRYVGKTKDPEQRKLGHRNCEIYNKSLLQWKKSISFNFKFEVVAVVDYNEWERAEKSWINYYRKIGKLYNIHDGSKYIPTSKKAKK
jgi:hypothetical protein